MDSSIPSFPRPLPTLFPSQFQHLLSALFLVPPLLWVLLLPCWLEGLPRPVLTPDKYMPRQPRTSSLGFQAVFLATLFIWTIDPDMTPVRGPGYLPAPRFPTSHSHVCQSYPITTGGLNRRNALPFPKTYGGVIYVDCPTQYSPLVNTRLDSLHESSTVMAWSQLLGMSSTCLIWCRLCKSNSALPPNPIFCKALQHG